MEYNALPQHDAERASDGRGSASAPAYDNAYQAVALEHENLGGTDASQPAKTPQDSITRRIGSLMRSIGANGPSYEMVDADDYDNNYTSTEPLRLPKHRAANGGEQALKVDQNHSPPGTSVPLRTASISRSLPLSSPKPDLQTFQGAYVGNVERLEESAERLSTTSSLEEEIQKLKIEQRKSEEQALIPERTLSGSRPVSRQVSSASHSNSIIGVNSAARSGGYSPGGYITSPKGSIGGNSFSSMAQTSASSRVHRLSSLPELRHKDQSSKPSVTSRGTDEAPPPLPHRVGILTPDISEPMYEKPSCEDEEEKARPLTSGSGATVDQAKYAFLDFDGVHRIVNPSTTTSRQSSVRRHVSQKSYNPSKDTSTSQQRDSVSEQEASEGRVFYPAPVPMMLNLPQKLSKLPSAAELERRRLQGLSKISPEARKSAAWLAGDAINERRQEASDMPPQLRATAFFEHRARKQNVEIKGGSAVDTLDAILDASAFAPVGAFVDHPFAGSLGSEVYGKPKGKKKPRPGNERRKRRSSIGDGIRRVVSSSGLTAASRSDRQTSYGSRKTRTPGFSDEEGDDTTDLERNADHSIQPSGDELSDNNTTDVDEDGHEDLGGELQYEAPTTLLAELQMRKEQQKQRNRQVATILPNGMRTTLLEQDAVARIQKQSRNQKHITLAWEDHEIADQTNYDDEDIPLGVLYSGKKAVENATRPMGLLERKDIEENEPLSNRRSRLRGAPIMTSREASLYQQQRASVGHGAINTGKDDEEEEDAHPGETLAERINRLKAQKGTAADLTSDFATDVLSQIMPKEQRPTSSKTPDAEETLAQRRRRLKAENEARNAAHGEITGNLKSRHNMADLLSAHPASGPHSRKSSAERRPLEQRQSNHTLLSQAHLLSGSQLQTTSSFNPPSTLPGYQIPTTIPPPNLYPPPQQQQQLYPFHTQTFNSKNHMFHNSPPTQPLPTFTTGYDAMDPTSSSMFQMMLEQQQQLLQYQQHMLAHGWNQNQPSVFYSNRKQSDGADQWRQSVM